MTKKRKTPWAFAILLILQSCNTASKATPAQLAPTEALASTLPLAATGSSNSILPVDTLAPSPPPATAGSSNSILPTNAPTLLSTPTAKSASTSAPPPTARPALANSPTAGFAATQPTPTAQPAAANTPTATARPANAGGPTLAGCPVFPANNIWNTRVDSLPVHPLSDAYVNSIGPDVGLHPDFGSGLWDGGPIGIPFITVPGNQLPVNVTFDYDDESDAGPYPVPPDAPIEGGPASDGDRHILVVDRDHCKLYELYAAYPEDDENWIAGSGAIYDLNSNSLRPATWTSADAAGLPILPGLVRYDEVAAGEIKHAIRFTAEETQRLFVWPARHFASDVTNSKAPPMGQRFRLKASFDISSYPRDAQVILVAMKTYGLILADNGSSWFISGAPDERWDNDVLVSTLGEITGSNFEAVDTSSLMISPDSGEARQP